MLEDVGRDMKFEELGEMPETMESAEQSYAFDKLHKDWEVQDVERSARPLPLRPDRLGDEADREGPWRGSHGTFNDVDLDNPKLYVNNWSW